MLPHYFAYTATLPMLVVAIVSFTGHSSMALSMPCGAYRRHHLVTGTLADFLNELLTVRALTHGEEMLLSVVVKTSLEQKRAVAKSEL